MPVSVDRFSQPGVLKMDDLVTRTQRKQDIGDLIAEQKTAALIVNARARRGTLWFRAARKRLVAAGYTLTGSYAIKDPCRLPEVVQHAVEGGAKLIIIGGGDGTISSVVDYLAKRNVVLGLLPLGTGNSFARTIGIPLSLEGAIDTIVNGKVVDVDLGVANGDHFANIVSIGFNALVVHRTSNIWKRRLGVVAYLLSAFKEIISNRPFTAQLELDGEVKTFRTRQIIVANGAFFGVNKIAASASADDRRLRVCVVDSEKKYDLLRLWFGLVQGRPAAYAPVKILSAHEVVCRTDTVQDVDIDGELTAATPLRLSIDQQALLVMAPKDFIDR